MPSRQSTLLQRLTRIVLPRHVSAASRIEDLRWQFNSLFKRFAPVPAGATFQPGELGPVKGEWVVVEGADPQRLVLYLHGGGYIAGSPETHRPLIARLCQAANARGFSLAYRLAPEFPFPAGLRDCLDAYRFLLKTEQPSSIVLAGDDAGGGLAFACLIAIRNANLPMPAGCVAISPWVDLSLTGSSMLVNAGRDAALSWQLLFMNARHYLQKQSAADPYASPIYANFRDFPPLMVHAGSLEILRDDASRIGGKAAEAGVPISVEIYDGMQHAFQAMSVSEAKVSLQRMGQFIRGRSSASAQAAAAAQ